MGHGRSRPDWTSRLALLLLIAGATRCLADGGQQDKLSAPKILDGDGSSGGGKGGGSGPLMSCTSHISSLGSLPVAKAWSEAAPLTTSRDGLARGACVAYTIPAKALAATPCGEQSPDRYVLVEFWQLEANSSGAAKAPGSVGGAAGDVRVLAARGAQPWITVGGDGHVKITPQVRDPDTGLTPVGTFQDDAAVVFSRPSARVLFPTNSPVTDGAGEQLDPDSWYVTIANMPDQAALPGFAIRASCVVPKPPGKVDGRIGSAVAAAAAAANTSAATDGVPCPVPTPGGKQCSGRGVCRADPAAQVIDNKRFCDCDAGYGSWACQLALPSLPLNAPAPTVVTVPPGQWGFWEVTLPGLRGPGAGGDRVAAAAAGLGPGLVGNEALLLTAERLVSPGYGGNPLVFLKPFMTKDHNQPALDGLDNDVVAYSDLRSFQLQLNRHFVLTRLPLRGPRGIGPMDAPGGPGAGGLLGGALGGGGPPAAYTMPRRWYVGVFNSNASRLSEPVRLALRAQYRDLNRQQLACPFDCSGAGRCVDPRSAVSLLALPQSAPDARTVTPVGPMQDLSPFDAGFMCACDAGFGGATCEGRLSNVTVGSGDQKLGPETLNPGDWWFYQVTVDPGFNPQSQDLGIQWTIGEPASPPNNYTNAFISFDQGPLPSPPLMGSRLAIPVRKGMTPYSKLIVRNNPPLPLQVPGGQLSPGGQYVVSVFNSDYVAAEPFSFTLNFFVMSDNATFLHPYMSILLGVTAAVILCLAMTLCKRVVMRYGLLPWRWRQRRAALAAEAAAGAALGAGAGGNSLALVLMAQTQQSNRGVPPEVFRSFPCRPYSLKDFQQRQHGVATQQRDATDAAAPDQRAGGGGGAAAGAVDVAAGAGRQPGRQHGRQQPPARTAGAAAAAAAAAVAAAAAGSPQSPQSPQSPPSAAARSPTAKPPQSPPAGSDDAALLRDDDAPSCTVCLCEYVQDELVRQLPCGHEFHQACIDQWMASHGTCPICRAPLWHGAFELDAAGSDGDSDGDPPAAIYVHHDMPGGGFGGGGGAGGGAGAAGGAGGAAAAGGGGAAAAAGAGVGGMAAGVQLAALGDHQQRLAWQPRQHQHQQHSRQHARPRPQGSLGEHPRDTGGTAAAAAAATDGAGAAQLVPPSRARAHAQAQAQIGDSEGGGAGAGAAEFAADSWRAAMLSRQLRGGRQRYGTL